MDPSADPTVDAVLDRALAAYADLTERAEEIDDEWSYIQDLTEAWRDRVESVRISRATETLDAAVAEAVDTAIAEIARIADPHRAIDWLSTFPQVVLISLGERP
ncbi:MAG TPA: hypothetical protein VFM38_09755 [Candidatus Limnocylindrales bacterium]|nr:hypothetical protein [Candidatus Limnocylindrales bacterium]